MSMNPVPLGCAEPHTCSRSTRLSVMAESELTKDLTDEQRETLDEFITSWAWGEGDPLITAGAPMSGTYILAAGNVRLTRDTVVGREVTVDILTPGEILGPVDTKIVPATESAWAMQTVCALYIPAHALAEVVTQCPQFALALLRVQQEKVYSGRETEVANSTLPVSQRVARVLMRLHHKLGQLNADGSSLLQVRLRREDIAGMAGTTLESVSRTMSQFAKDGLTDGGREWIRLENLTELAALAEV